jgi:hypothetical protein
MDLTPQLSFNALFVLGLLLALICAWREPPGRMTAITGWRFYKWCGLALAGFGLVGLVLPFLLT